MVGIGPEDLDPEAMMVNIVFGTALAVGGTQMTLENESNFLMRTYLKRVLS